MTLPSVLSPEPDVVDVPPLYAKRQQAMVEPMARDVKQPRSTRSRAEAAKAQDQVNMARMMNQEASSGKCVWISWGSIAPAATKA